MSHPVKTAINFALAYILAELIMVATGYHLNEMARFVTYAANTLFLLLAVFISIRKETKLRKGIPTSFLVDIKTGLKAVGVYALSITVFVYFYYNFIVPDYTIAKVETVRAAAQAHDFAELQRISPKEYGGMSHEEFVELMVKNAQYWLNPSKVVPITLLGLMLIGFIYTFILTAINRRVLSKFRS
ncbi:MAG: DUF4199 family protein [Flavobacteriales bacterium]